MRILVINSNTTDSVTDRIGAAARAVASPGTEIEAVSAPFGLPLIVTRADWLVAGPATLAALAARRGTYDAAVIACFGDPGLDAAKELVDVPVLGISEAAFHAACMLGRRFGVVSFTAALRPMFEECLAHHGLAARCAGFRMGPPFAGDPGRALRRERGAGRGGGDHPRRRAARRHRAAAAAARRRAAGGRHPGRGAAGRGDGGPCAAQPAPAPRPRADRLRAGGRFALRPGMTRRAGAPILSRIWRR